MSNAADALFLSKKLTDDVPSSFVPPKVFAQPFRVALKRGETDDVTWIEVRSLDGLRNLFEKIEKGELTEIDRFSSIEMQLWGLMAEHAGFLRTKGSPSSFAAGIQPLGEQTAALADDLSMFTGGDEVAALKVLDSMKKTLKQRPLDQTPMEQVEATHEFVKEDGINLTEEGEDALIKLVLGGGPKVGGKELPRSKEGIQFEKDRDNAIQLFLETPAPTDEEKVAETAANLECKHHGDKPLHEICKENAQPPTEEPKIVGGEAARVGHLIAVAARGLDSEADEDVREQSQTAIDILSSMIEGGYRLDQKSFDDVMKENDVTMDEWKKLAGIGGTRIKRTHPRPNEQSKLDPLEARKNQEANLQKLVKNFDENEIMQMVAQSPSQQPDERLTEEGAARDDEAWRARYDEMNQRREEANAEAKHRARQERFVEEIKKVADATPKRPLNFVEEKDQVYGSDHYKPREVTPADPHPRGAYVMAESHRRLLEREAQAKQLEAEEDSKSNDSEESDD